MGCGSGRDAANRCINVFIKWGMVLEETQQIVVLMYLSNGGVVLEETQQIVVLMYLSNGVWFWKRCGKSLY